jgi:hypothetical protein
MLSSEQQNALSGIALLNLPFPLGVSTTDVEGSTKKVAALEKPLAITMLLKAAAALPGKKSA